MTGTDSDVAQVSVTLDDPATPEDEGSRYIGLGLFASGFVGPGQYENRAGSLGVSPLPSDTTQNIVVSPPDDVHAAVVMMPPMP